MIKVTDDSKPIYEGVKQYQSMGDVSDGYTDGVSNTQRYKTLGNAFNADVIAHILSFIP
jgi:hypothetical protein